MISIENSNCLHIKNSVDEHQIKAAKTTNEISPMQQLELNGVVDRNDGSKTNGVSSELINNFNGIFTKQSGSLNQRNNSNNLAQNSSKIEYTTVNNFHSPKVFTSNSITVNTPAKDVLGSKFNNFAKNLTKPLNESPNYWQKQKSTNLSATTSTKTAQMPVETPATVLTKVNNSTANNGHSSTNGNSYIGNGEVLPMQSLPTPITKLQPTSACYDRYPKPGSYGSLQVYPMNGLNSVINNANAKENLSPKAHQHCIYMDRTPEEEISKVEQDRLEEILKMCADFERQNQNVQSSPIVQNRIKTNGSLPREKKSPISPDHMRVGNADVFFPSRQTNQSPLQPLSPQFEMTRNNNGYENFKISLGHTTELTPTSPSSRYYENSAAATKSPNTSPYINNGYENITNVRKSPVGYVPQSPRTRIKTFISPKKEPPTTPIQRKTDYELLVQSFEEKLRFEAQQLREQRGINNGINQLNGMPTPSAQPFKSKTVEQNQRQLQTQQQQHQHRQHSSQSEQIATALAQSINSNASRPSDAQKNIYGSLQTKNKNINNLTVNIKKSLDEKQIEQLKRQQVEVLKNTRELKTQISELQRQEEEVLRELDLEKALVSAELSTEQNYLNDLEKSMTALQAKIHRMEAQRNANRVLQETQQNKLKQMIDMKQSQVDGLKEMILENESDDALKEEMNEMIELLENDTKTFEDLEFQYLEEETEWLAYREDLYSERKLLSRRIAEKRKHIQSLEAQGIDNQNTACTDTKNIEKDIWTRLNQLEKHREELKTIDTLLFELSGEKNAPSDSEEDVGSVTTTETKRLQTITMSQSLFGSQEILNTKHSHATDLMSKSVNENLFSNKIETLPFTSQDFGGDEKQKNTFDAQSTDRDDSADNLCTSNDEKSVEKDAGNSDPLQKLKYNLSTFDHNVAANDADESNASKSAANLNLSIESDDFEVNPLEKRVPSQDDIDRISKVTSNAPISTDGASYKVIESIKEIERNRQLLLAQQGSHVIEHERQKMSELKKKSHDEARAQYMQLQNHCDDKYRNKSGSLENLGRKKNDGTSDGVYKREQSVPIANSTPHKENETQKILRHSHPEVERERPLSEANSEISYDALSDKQYKSFSDIRSSSGRINDHDMSGGSHRGSIMSSENSESGRMVSGARRNLPKHQRPLTRYLPIMSADLDLRLHIESAGHQVNLCPHVVVDSFSCRGYLHKLGATFHGWSKRWFVLDRQKMALIYYSDKSERKPRGGAYFSTIDEVYLDHLNTSKSGRPHCTFIVKTKRRSYHLQAASDSAARIWIDAIITGAQGNIDY